MDVLISMVEDGMRQRRQAPHLHAELALSRKHYRLTALGTGLQPNHLSEMASEQPSHISTKAL